jgi:hypothetical protein
MYGKKRYPIVKSREMPNGLRIWSFDIKKVVTLSEGSDRFFWIKFSSTSTLFIKDDLLCELIRDAIRRMR